MQVAGLRRAFPSATLDKAVFDFRWIINNGHRIVNNDLAFAKFIGGITCNLSQLIINMPATPFLFT